MMRKKILILLLLTVLFLQACDGNQYKAEHDEGEQTIQSTQVKTDQDKENSGLTEKIPMRAVFAWYGIENDDKELFDKYSIDTILLDRQHKDLIPELKEYRVLLLDGNPEWGIKEMMEVVEDAEKSGADGIVFDIEDSYAELAINLEELHSSLPVYCCIPFWLDDLTQEKTDSAMTGKEIVNRIIKATDGVFVMNYLKENEREQIQTEMDMCDGKEIITIYELQPAGEYELKECNTYYMDGLNAVEDNYRAMFGNTDVGIAYHNLAMMRQLDKRDDLDAHS